MAQDGLGLETINTFGELLRHLRQRARLTQDELGLAVGYSRAHVARLESNQRAPDLAIVRARFVEALGLQQESDLAARLIALAAVAHDEPAGDTEIASQPAAPHIPNNLPIQVTSFVGRTGELAELKRLLAPGGTRLLTLTGSGGTGKTRLALEVAAACVRAMHRPLQPGIPDTQGGASPLPSPYPDGIWLVELAPLSDPAFVPQTIARVLGVREEAGRPMIETLLGALRAHNTRLLLILDNCEHLIDACAQFADAVLRNCQAVRILATSREVLGIAGEVAWRVPSLQTPDARQRFPLAELAGYEAVRLFVERATVALPSFELTAGNGATVQQIVERLDGIPLAIELAAARVRALTPEKIAERLSDRFGLLTGGSRTALPRQQTLRGAIDWSYDLLPQPERILLRRLSVFAGSWSLEAAEAVCVAEGIEPSDVLDLLMHLVDKSLVIMSDVDGALRYHLLETIRQYAHEKLSDTVAHARDHHLDYFLKLSQELGSPLNDRAPSDQVSLVKRLEPDVDNVHSALDWAVETQRIEDGYRLANALQNIWIVLGTVPRLLEAMQRLLDHLAADENRPLRMEILYFVARMYFRQDYIDQAWTTGEQVLDIAIALDDRWAEIEVLGFLSTVCLFREDPAKALAYLEQRRTIARTILDPEMWERDELRLLLEFAFHTGNYPQTQILLERESVVQPSGNKVFTSGNSRLRGYTFLYQSQWSEAGASLRESLLDNAALGDRLAVAACLGAFAAMAMGCADLERAAQLFGASEATRESVGMRFMAWDQREIRRNVNTLRSQVDEGRLNAAWAAGRAMTYDQAMAYALSDANMPQPFKQ